MTTTINNKHNKLNFSSEREQSQACLNSAEHEKNQGRKVLNVPNLRFKEFLGEWEKCKLGELTTKVGSGSTPKGGNAVYTSVGHCFVRSQNVGMGYLILDDIAHIDDDIHQKHKATELNEDDVLLNITGASIGRTAIATKEIEGGNVNQHVCIIRANSKVSPKFLCNYIQTKKIQNYIQSLQTGGSREGLNFEQIRSFPISLPNIAEQNKIAQLLDKLNERIATQNKIIEDLKKLKSAISKKLLCNDKWTTYKIQDIAEIGRGRVISSVEIDRQKHPLYPVYSSQTSNNGIMGYLDNYMFDGEYITWTTDGANAGTVFYRKGKFNCTNVCGTLKILPKFDCYFVSLVLQQATQKYVSSNLANPKLMNNTMASIKIKMPNIETQKQLSKVFQALDGCLFIHQRTCKMYLSEKQYLLRQMFI